MNCHNQETKLYTKLTKGKKYVIIWTTLVKILLILDINLRSNKDVDMWFSPLS